MKFRITMSLIIQSIILISAILLLVDMNYTVDREPRYNRLSLPEDFSNPTNVDNIHDFGIEFISMMYPDQVFTKSYSYPHTNYTYSKSFFTYDDYNVTLPSGLWLYVDNPRHASMYFTFHNDIENFDYWSSDLYQTYHNSSTFFTSCGDKTGELQCLAYVDEDGDGCVLAVNNGSFSFVYDDMPYCPNKKSFKDKKQQMANYIYDGFMALDIPEEFSWEAQKQLHGIVNKYTYIYYNKDSD